MGPVPGSVVRRVLTPWRALIAERRVVRQVRREMKHLPLLETHDENIDDGAELDVPFPHEWLKSGQKFSLGLYPATGPALFKHSRKTTPSKVPD